MKVPLIMYSLDETRAVLVKQSEDRVSAMKGLGKELWRSLGGGTKYLKKERASWKKK